SYNLEKRLNALFWQTVKKEKEAKTKEELEGIITLEFGTYTKFMENAVSNTESGATELRSLMKAIKETGTELGYVGAPKYRLFAEGTDYVDAEAKIDKVKEL